MEKKIEVWIDTGGTFTDALSEMEKGSFKRCKVLSSAKIKAQALRAKEDLIWLECNWPGKASLLTSYSLQLVGEAEVYTIQEVLDHEQLRLDRPLPTHKNIKGASVEIYSGEEAPILACRMLLEKRLEENLPTINLRLGTTKGTNALLERKGARVGLLVNEGFEDLLLIRDQSRPHLFSLDIQKEAPFYKVSLGFSKRLNIRSWGSNAMQDSSRSAQEEPLKSSSLGENLEESPEKLAELLQALKEQQVESLAISALFAFKDPQQEQKLKAFFAAKGFPFISLGSDLASSIRYLPRTETAVIQAYLEPVLNRYLASIKTSLHSSSQLQIMDSMGNLLNERLFKAKDSLFSGPAGGVVGSYAIGQKMGRKKVLTFDMGGTSTDVSRISEGFDFQECTRVGEARILSPSIAIETVAAGGGSLCYFDGHRLCVGPESSGADPGPACYGQGEQLALTDINLLSGKLIPATFNLPLYQEKAQQLLEQLMRELKDQQGEPIEKEALLEGFQRIANEKMMEAIRKISVHQGYDPKEYALLAYGGAGGQHACDLAELLGMKEVLIPFDAGLLSAYGMGQAVFQQALSRDVLMDWEKAKKQLSGQFRDLENKLSQQLSGEGLAPEEQQIKFKKVFLRLKDQESSIEMPWHSDEKKLIQQFKQRYINIYGHWVPDRAVEIEKIQVMIGAPDKKIDKSSWKQKDTEEPRAEGRQSVLEEGVWKEVDWYRWESLKAGTKINGPAILGSASGTFWLKSHWKAQVDDSLNVLAQYHELEIPSVKKIKASNQSHSLSEESIALSLFTNRFMALAEQMGGMLERTAFSVNIKERLDFSCALLDQNAELVVNAPHIPVHLGSLGLCLRKTLGKVPLQEGDIAITNHPGYGGSHLPDITLMSGLFVDGKCLAYLANRCHHAEVGGIVPGSLPTEAKRLDEEGVVIPPTLIARDGQVDWELVRSLFEQGPHPSRSVEENLADLNAALASLERGKQLFLSYCQQYGTAAVSEYLKKIPEHAAQQLKGALAKDWKKGKYQAQERLDDGSLLKVSVSIHASGLNIDFSGSSSCHPGNLNANPAIVNSVVMYVLRLMVKENIPLNEGLLRAVDIRIPKGSLLDPNFPENPADCPAVVGGNTELSQRLTDTLLKALGMAACSQGTMNNVVMGNENFGYYETLAGGVGAGKDFHGAHAVHQHMTNTRITDPEVLEFRYPLRLKGFSLRRGSGGHGAFKGGEGLIREYEFMEKLHVSLLTEHRKEGPYGLEGGENGQCGKNLYLPKDGEVQDLGSRASLRVEPGDRLRIESPGGGAYGK